MSFSHFSKKTVIIVNLICLNISVLCLAGATIYNLYFSGSPASSQAMASITATFPEEELCAKVLEEVNRARLKTGLDPLQSDDTLTLAAYRKVEDVVEYNYFSHVNPSTQKRWSDFIRESNYEYQEIGENLAIGYANPTEVVKAWMDSPTHKNNMLSTKFNESGMAYRKISYKGADTILIVHFLGG